MAFPEKTSYIGTEPAAAGRIFLYRYHALQRVCQLVAGNTPIAGSAGMNPHGADNALIGSAKCPAAGLPCNAPGIIHNNNEFVLTRVFSGYIGTKTYIGDI